MYRKVKRDEVTPRERKGESLFEATPEWRHMKADIDAGLKKNDSAEILLSASDWKRIGLSNAPQRGRNVATGSRSICRFIQSYLDTANLAYRVHAYRGVDGRDVVRVDGC